MVIVVLVYHKQNDTLLSQEIGFCIPDRVWVIVKPRDEHLISEQQFRRLLKDVDNFTLFEIAFEVGDIFGFSYNQCQVILHISITLYISIDLG